MNKENIPCCFSEVNEVGKHITNCNNLPTKLDKDNVQVRYFCEIHLKQVKETRKLMHKNCINKEKIIKDLEERITWLTNEISNVNVKYFKQIEFYIWEKICLKNLIIKIEQGEFE